MTFWTFFLYFIGAIVLLVVGLKVVLWIIACISVVTQETADGARRLIDKRAASKWAKVEAKLDDEKDGDGPR